MSGVVTNSYVKRFNIISSWESLANLQDAAKAILVKFKEIDNKTDDQLGDYRKELNKKYVPRSYNKSGANAQHGLFDANDIGIREDSSMKSPLSSDSLERLRKELKPENSAVWKNASADVKRSMLKIKVYDEYLQLFNDELAKNGDKELSNALKNIRELVGYHLDTNNFWISWKEQENIVTERLTALANNKIIGKEKSWFGLFSNYYFIHTTLAAKYVFDDIMGSLTKSYHLGFNSILNEYQNLLKNNSNSELSLARRKDTRLNTLTNYFKHVFGIASCLGNYLSQHNLIENKCIPLRKEAYAAFIDKIKKHFSSYKYKNGFTIFLYDTPELKMILDSGLKLNFILNSIDSSGRSNKLQINLQNFEEFKVFLSYLSKISFAARLYKALDYFFTYKKISKKFDDKYSSSLFPTSIFSHTEEVYDQLWLDILDELLPKNADKKCDEHAKELLTKETFLLDFVLNMLERKLAGPAYNEIAEFNRFIQYLKSPDKVSLQEAEIRILTWLARSFLAPDMQDVKHPEEEVKNLKTEINNLLDSKVETENSEPL